MDNSKNEKSTSSLTAFIEKTAKMLRLAAKPLAKNSRSYQKKIVSLTGKIEQVAAMLRNAVKKKKR